MSATWSPSRAGDRPELVEGGDGGAGDLAEAVLELLLGDPELLRDLLVGRRAAELRLELADRALDVAGAGADGARHPVHRAQLVDDLPLDPRDRVRLELHVARRVVALDRADQAEEAVRDEVALVDVGRQPGAEPPGDVLDERRVGEDQPVAELLVAGLPEFEPQLWVSSALATRREYGVARRTPQWLSACDCGKRTPTSVASQAATATAAAPTRSRRASLCAGEGVRGDGRQGGCEDGEERPERVPLHAPSVLPYSGGSSGNPPVHCEPTQGRSSVGRAAVSKTVGRGFESLRPCWLENAAIPVPVWACGLPGASVRRDGVSPFVIGVAEAVIMVGGLIGAVVAPVDPQEGDHPAGGAEADEYRGAEPKALSPGPLFRNDP